LTQGKNEVVFVRGLRGGGAGRCDGLCAGGGDGFEDVSLVFCVAPDDFDKVGDEVVPAFKLGINLGPGVVTLKAKLDEVVICDCDPDKRQKDYRNYNYQTDMFLHNQFLTCSLVYCPGRRNWGCGRRFRLQDLRRSRNPRARTCSGDKRLPTANRTGYKNAA
jgi:hypothetical protein